ncbi:hypothetical protein [Saccharibacillus sp. JS10]|uniref:hypothetical protein n=1 Tax=Saccharibacillus sp. JS10 TaxID=2950552 RepID=UPI00210EDB58|nr:hypothetical protein [Saccharibacillus sp. JS10]MCQ4086715.1 hypothetical protein [Saccharibacillus sp. JS10]
MSDKEILRNKLQAILVLIKTFMSGSSMSYIEGSSDIVESGAYEWLPLTPGQKIDQSEICDQYRLILNEVTHLKLEGKLLDRFNESGKRVLSFLQQDSIVWQSNSSDVYDEIVRELGEQLELSEQI